MGEISLLLVLGHRHDLGSFLQQEFVKGFRGTKNAILKTPPASDPLLPTGDAAVLDHEDRARAPHRHTVLEGIINHRENLQFDLSLEPLTGNRPYCRVNRIK